MNHLTNFIKAERKRSGLTMTELAEASEISLSYLCDIEKNRRSPSPETLRRLCRQLGADYRKAVKQVLKDVEAKMLDKFDAEG